MNNYEHTFFTTARVMEFWKMVAGLLSLASPGVLIVIAIMIVSMLFTIVIFAFKKAANVDKNDNDYDIKYYD